MKLYEIKRLVSETVDNIRNDNESWDEFLIHASHVYRYRFQDQTLIYAQKPDAVACATMNIWNNKMGCWIKRGNKGIALLDENNNKKLRYVWDVSSVVPRNGGRLPNIWIRKEYHDDAIRNRLKKIYGSVENVKSNNDVNSEDISSYMGAVIDYIAGEYASEITDDKYPSYENTPIMSLDEEKNARVKYQSDVKEFFRYGISCMVGERMKLAQITTGSYDMSFIQNLSKYEFCTLSDTMTGAAGQLLRQIGIAVLTYDRQHGIDNNPNQDYNALKRESAEGIVNKNKEMEGNNYGVRVHAGRGLSDTESDTEQRATGGADEVRTDAQKLPEAETSWRVRSTAYAGRAAGEVSGRSEESAGRDGQISTIDDEAGRSDRGTQEAESDEVGRNGQQHQEPGRGDSERHDNRDIVDNIIQSSTMKLYFLPDPKTEDEQRKEVEKYDYLNPRKADAVPNEYKRQVLLRGTGFEGGMDRILDIYMNEMDRDKRVKLIKSEYGLGGASWPIDGTGLHGYDTYGSQGIRIQWRDAEGEVEASLSWKDIEQEIGALILTGEYISRDRQNNDIIQEAEESDDISQTTEMQESVTEENKSEELEQLSFTDFINIESDNKENDTQPELLDETESGQNDNIEQQNNEDFTERAADYTALLVLAETNAAELTKRQKAHRNISALKILKQIEKENRPATADERTIMSAYLGWGGIPEVFEENNDSWSSEYSTLKELLTPEEYDSARASTLNAHFTDISVIDAMYKVLNNLGFTKGNILEPSMGIGNFFSRLPADMSESRLYGVELDPVTGKMAQLIYPEAHIDVKGYEKTDFQNDFFDVTIGNVPFGQYKVLDKDYDKHNFYIHDYFFAKTLDKVRPGGVIALITSKGTMDKANPAVRKYISQRAELLGAIRLPNDAFKNAGTSVTSDIIFLKKREAYLDIDEDWIHLGIDENGIEMNSYFVNNPQMILGTMQMVNGPYGQESACVPDSGTSFEEKLNNAVGMIRGEISIDDTEISDEELEEEIIPAEAGVKNFSYCAVDGKIYYRENSVMRPREMSERMTERVMGLISIRDCVSELIGLQMDEADADKISASQERLNKIYDQFTAEYGAINSRTNQSAFREDSGYSLLSSLELLDDSGNVTGKADMFSKRTIRKAVPVSHVDTSVEALSVSMGEKARVDLNYMEKLTGKSEEELINDLSGIIFHLPDSGTWQTSEEYLSGNIRQKLRAAELAAETDSSYSVNVEYLKKAMPVPLTAAEIDVRLGATWVDPKYIEQFMMDVIQTPKRLFQREWVAVKYAPITGEWNIKGKREDYNNPLANSTYGTARISAYQILENTLNLRDVKVYDRITDVDGKEKSVINKEQTMLATQKQDALKEAFKDWVFADQERRDVLVEKYNELYNSSKPREYDGSHLSFPGMTPDVELKAHQKNAVAHVLYGDNTLLAHCVGAGKTFEMIASAMESKRLGLCHKSLFVVPNHLTEQWASDFLRLYPGANVLAATKKDFEPARRKRFCARIATGEYDAVIIGHSQFGKIPLSPERQKRLIENQIESITESIREAKESNGEHFTIKQMEKTKKNLEVNLKKLSDNTKKDNVVTFEQLGVDRLFVDESQEFKNLFLFTKMRNVAGISQNDSQKASDMFGKCQYIDEITGGRGITFATGTPISNSMTELYTNMRYLQYDRLKELGLENFDAWASTFGETQTAIELAPEGTGYRAKTRFSKFFNLPELISLFKESADIQTADMLKLPVPECDYENVVLKPSDFQKEIVKSLGDRAENIRNGGVDSSIDNMLKVTNDGRKCALDQRLINSELPDNENSKVNACAAKAFDIWNETADKKSAQLIFCDASTPRTDGGFDVYNAIKDKLTEKGVPPKEIAFIHEANTDKKKAELFAKVRSGQVRFLLGSTPKMGAGTNVQTRLIALHHIDVPWRPSDIEQQEGRILRQGNQNERVKIFRYVTENTFDSYSWQLIENKQKFIGQIMTSKSPVRSCDDVDEAALSYAEVKALATGNPYIKEKMTLDTEVAKLKLMKANFKSQKYRLEDDITKGFPRRIAALQEKIEGTKQDIVTRDTNQSQSDDEFAITVNGMTYTDKKDGGAALIAAVKDTKNIDREKVGRYCGFDLYGRFDVFANGFRVYLQGKMEHILDISSDPHGMITRLNNCMTSFDRTLTEAEEALADTCAKLETAKTEVTKEFDKEDILAEKLERLSFLNAQLDIDKNGEGGGQPEENSIENESHEVKAKTEYKEVRVSNVVHEKKSVYMRL